MSGPRSPWVVFLLVAPSLTGCSAHSGSHQREVGFAPTSASTSSFQASAELDRRAEQLGREGASVDDLRGALEALEELQRHEDEAGRLDVMIRRARVTQFLVESLTEEDDVLRWCRRGEGLAETIREIAPERVEGHYYGALFLGMRAQHQQVRAALWLDELESLGRDAVELDEGYDDAGPLRFMGMFLVSAPAWPLGPGDPEAGVDLLRHAVELSDYPLNKLLLARGLIENDDERSACQALSEAFSAPQEGRWAVTGPRWRAEARQLASQISCQLQSPPGYAVAH